MQDSPQRSPVCPDGAGCRLCGTEEAPESPDRTGRAAIRAIDRFLPRLDPLLTGPLGIPLMLAGLYVLLLAIMRAGTLMVGVVDAAATLVLAELPGRLLAAAGAPRWLSSVLVGGIGAGVRAVVALVPLIFVISFALSYLDQWGWMARAARALEGVLGRVGLTGRALAPLLAGFGCTVPAVLALRAPSIEARRERQLALFVAPLFSCSARLSVYAVFAAAFFPRIQELVVLSLYVVGLLLAAGTAALLSRTLLPAPAAVARVILVPYRLPRASVVARQAWHRARHFALGAGRVIVLVVAVLAVANTLGVDGRLGAEGTGRSVLAVVATALAPAFAPMGLHSHDWHAPVALVAGVGGKEAILGAFSGLAGQQGGGSGGGLLATMKGSFDGGPEVYAFLLFVLIYAPCAATIVAVAREAGRRFAAAQGVWFTALAWAVATLTYQVAAGGSGLWIAAALGCLAVLVAVPVAAARLARPGAIPVTTRLRGRASRSAARRLP